MPEEIQQTDTPDKANTSSSPLDTPAPTESDEILSDIRNSAASAPEEPKADEPEADPQQEPESDEIDPNGVLMRDDYLRRLNKLAAEKEAFEAERRAFEEAKAQSAPPTQPQSEPSPAPKADDPILSAWEAKKVEIEQRWNQYQDPEATANERALVETTDALIKAQAQNQQALEARLQAIEQRPIIEKIGSTAELTATTLKAEFGLEVTPQQIIDTLQGGALQAYAILQGKQPKDLPISKETFMAAYELANQDTFRGLRTPAKPAPAKPKVPDLQRGGGASLQQDLSEEDEILNDIRIGTRR